MLKSFYEKEKTDIISILDGVLQMEFIELAERPQLKHALALFSDNAIELQDAFNIVFACSRPATDFKTFDKKLNKVFHEKTAYEGGLPLPALKKLLN